MERWQQIESLFQEALRKPVSERDAWLREACATDTDLHREVVLLLANHHESASAGPWAAAAARLIVKPVLLEPGQFQGPYQKVPFRAAGGMGLAFEHGDLLAQSKDLQGYVASRTEENAESTNTARNKWTMTSRL